MGGADPCGDSDREFDIKLPPDKDVCESGGGVGRVEDPGPLAVAWRGETGGTDIKPRDELKQKYDQN